MKLNQTYNELDKKSKEFLSEFTGKIANHSGLIALLEKTGGSLSISASKDVPNFIDFSLLNYEFCIEKSIFTTQNQCVFYTYVKMVDYENYPKIKLHSVNGANIVVDTFGNKVYSNYTVQKMEDLLINYIDTLINWIINYESPN